MIACDTSIGGAQQLLPSQQPPSTEEGASWCGAASARPLVDSGTSVTGTVNKEQYLDIMNKLHAELSARPSRSP